MLDKYPCVKHYWMLKYIHNYTKKILKIFETIVEQHDAVKRNTDILVIKILLRLFNFTEQMASNNVEMLSGRDLPAF